ncbi:hypothetical protein AOXY_G9404 [Acipenser oxyrinchus oxyrinchus]|uniref:Uncharacterized protein n=1 Tax=Acipenser oxyrinchus oxyrinchus TaxID=40147 RepID=A0AAD8G892_ACIOX|nr:hypothetical protein AOXY_G9404 [Acipenser oxyrinchus oxyrinchus]
MVLSRLLFSLLNNQQLIEKLAESRPIRRAAQITAFAITKAQITGRDAATKMLKSETLQQIRQETAGRIPRDSGELGRRARRVRETFVNEVKEGLRDAKNKDK